MGNHRPDRPLTLPHRRYGTNVPLAHQLADRRVLCRACLPPTEAQAKADAGEHVGDVQPWTVDLCIDDDDLRCNGCGIVLVAAPQPLPEDDDLDE